MSEENQGLKLFVGNLDWGVSDDQLREAFAPFGEIADCIIIKDQFGRSKGFGFVTFTNTEDAQKAIEAMNETEIGKRKVIVNEARPREARPQEDR